MIFKSRMLALVTISLLCAMLVSSASAAQTDPISPAEFREKFTEYMSWLDSNTPQNQGLASKVQAMSDEEFQYLYDSFADPDAFIVITEQVMAKAAQAQAASGPRGFTLQQALPATMLYSPAYPSGSVYDTWVATLPGLGLLSDSDGDGSLANERCSTDGESGISIAAGTLTAAAIVGDVACNSIVVILGEGTNLPACIAAGILHEAELANDIVANQCSSQDGLVDSAEIEAAYENSKLISGQVTGVANQIEVHDTDIKTTLAANQTELLNVLADNQAELLNVLADNQAELLDVLATNQAQSVKIEIEKALADTNDNKRLSYFYLPQAQGGLLETVRQTVLDAIDANQAAGLSTAKARSWFAKAEASFAGGDYKLAYDQYAKAYLELVK